LASGIGAARPPR